MPNPVYTYVYWKLLVFLVSLFKNEPENTVKYLNSSIWRIERTLTSTNTPVPSGPGIIGFEGVFHILQTPKLESHHPIF